MSDMKILCVDDEPEARDALFRALLDQEYQVLTASSGQECLELLESEPVQLVLTDYMMPGMNGLELMTRVREQHPEILGIVLSAVADWGLMAQALDSGEVYTFIPKPWNTDQLLFTIRRGLELVQTRQELRRVQDRLHRLEAERAPTWPATTSTSGPDGE